VRSAELADDLENPAQVQTSEIRYGKWSAKTGLKRGPLHPSEDFRRLEARGAVVFEHLLKVHDQLHFPFQDHFEYWLFDDEGQPFALLDSAVHEDTVTALPPAYWRAGLACRHSFHTDADISSSNGISASLSSADYLERYINKCAGNLPMAHWLQRHSDGSGTMITENETDPVFAADDFPEFFIRARRHDKNHRQMLEDFFSLAVTVAVVISPPR